MNRQQRRAQNKKTPGYQRMTKEQIVSSLVKNGITPEDLEREYNNGYKAGFEAGSIQPVKCIYAAVCLALNKLHGFGKSRCRDVLLEIDKNVLYTLTSGEIIDEVWSKIGLKIDFDDPLDRITEGE